MSGHVNNDLEVRKDLGFSVTCIIYPLVYRLRFVGQTVGVLQHVQSVIQRDLTIAAGDIIDYGTVRDGR